MAARILTFCIPLTFVHSNFGVRISAFRVFCTRSISTVPKYAACKSGRPEIHTMHVAHVMSMYLIPSHPRLLLVVGMAVIVFETVQMAINIIFYR